MKNEYNIQAQHQARSQDSEILFPVLLLCKHIALYKWPNLSVYSAVKWR